MQQQQTKVTQHWVKSQVVAYLEYTPLSTTAAMSEWYSAAAAAAASSTRDQLMSLHSSFDSMLGYAAPSAFQQAELQHPHNTPYAHPAAAAAAYTQHVAAAAHTQHVAAAAAYSLQRQQQQHFG